MKMSVQGVTFKDEVKSGFATPSWVAKERIKQLLKIKEECHEEK
ncbi:MAG: hypothetical protein PVI03_04305 [Candidatus Thorarchaeota archaeon]|jgi:hypothetical protein